MSAVSANAGEPRRGCCIPGAVLKVHYEPPDLGAGD